MSFNALATILLAWRLHAAPDLGRLTASAVRASLVAASAACLTGLSLHVISSRVGTLGHFLHLFGGGVIYVLLILCAVALFGDEVMRAAVDRLRKRIRPRRKSEA